ncbi:copper chaperone PCu(A)C [Actinopolyspora mortivallis]|uniref:copper chaperone PCu(A)C n=1 Tax=Actinopolyspora mortivallis TaxID=33906 RepID=UPI00035CB48D|nr:copper chaperone PCu(A)C [Actinopolyspora mortivallis]
MSRSQHSKAVRLRLVPAALGLGTVVALSGCATGQQAETSEQVAAIYGANGNATSMAIRNATLGFPDGQDAVYEEGSTAPVDAVLVNESARSDRLVRVSSSYADSVEITGTRTIPGQRRLYAVEPSENSNAVRASDDDRERVRITLTGLTQDIYPGVTVPVRFTFENAGSTTLQVPIGRSPEQRPEHGSPHDANAEHGSGSDSGSSDSHTGEESTEQPNADLEGDSQGQ